MVPHYTDGIRSVDWFVRYNDGHVDAVDGELVFTAGSGSIPAPRKRDSIAREAELLLTNYDLGHAGVSSGGSFSGGAAD